MLRNSAIRKAAAPRRAATGSRRCRRQRGSHRQRRGEPGAAHHRPADGAEHHGGGHAAPRRPPQQEPASVTVRPALWPCLPISAIAQSMKNLPAPECSTNSAVDREQHDVGRRDVERDADDPFERHVQLADHATDVVAAMRPWRRQIRAELRIGEEANRRDTERSSQWCAASLPAAPRSARRRGRRRAGSATWRGR